MDGQLAEWLGEAGQLAGITKLLSAPPTLRRGWTELVKPPQPAAAANFTRKIPSDTWERLVSVAATLVTSAGAGNRSLSLQAADQDGFIFAQALLAQQIGPSTTVAAFGALGGVTTITPGGGQANTGNATNPAAGATIVSVPVGPGVYRVSWSTELAGTIAAGDANNMRLSVGGGNALIALMSGAAGIYPQIDMEVIVGPAGGNIVVTAVANASGVAATYWASVSAQPIAGAQYQSQIPDITLKSGWSLSLAISNVVAGDQLQGIGLLLERYPSSLAAGVAP